MSRNLTFASNKLKTIFEINLVIIGQLLIITFGSLLIDSVTYLGFLSKIIFISSTQLYYLSLISIANYFFISLISNFKTKAGSFITLLNINYLIFPFLFITSFSLSQIEQNNFPNFIFSNYHIHISVLSMIVQISAMLFLIYIMDNFFFLKISNKNHDHFKSLIKKLTQKETIFFIVIAISISTQIFNSYSRLLGVGFKTIKHSFTTYEERREIVFGDYYIFFEFIKKQIPENSLVAVAPQSKEGILGNIGFSRYFLHPRFLLHPKQDDVNISDVDYVVVSSILTSAEENTFELWPEESFRTSGGYSIDMETLKVEQVNISIFNPNDNQFINKMTVLKVVK